MKKFRVLCLFLCLILLLQCSPLRVVATDTTTDPSQPETEQQAPAEEFGTTCITNGCRTINGMTPLGGSDRILKSARAAFIYEVNTETVIYSYNPDLRLYPGSLAKMVTALIAIEEGNLQEVVTFSTQWNASLPLRSIVADLKEGEEITLEVLVYWMMLESANDAALNIAAHIAGSQEAFVQMMNERVARMGCTDTHFTNVHGLDDPDQYTTARDMVRIILAATQNETFREVFGCHSYRVPVTNKVNEERVIASDNHLIYDRTLPQFNRSEVTGGKTSSTGGAGSSLVCTAEDKDMQLICVVMGTERQSSDGRVTYYGNFEEMFDLLDFAFDGFRICRVLFPDMTLNQFPVIGGECDVVGHPDVSVNSVLPVNTTLSNLIFRYTVVDGGLTAPIAQGQKIATVSVWYRTSCVTESAIFAMNPVRSTVNSGVVVHSVATRDDSNITGFLKFLGILFLVLVVPFGIYLVINHMRRMAARERRRRYRSSRRRSR